MAKIHTHYDNLKVARMAPQEVIRAAYKALSQKYHPDKNPGDEKAARIMAIVNTAYTALNDPVRRKEHDEWIAAEEWEVAWLESTHQEEGARNRANGVPDGHGGEGAGKRALRRYLALLAAAGVGAAVALGMAFPNDLLPMLGLAPASVVRTAPAPLPRAAPARALDDNWSSARAAAPDKGGDELSKISILATTGLIIAPRPANCANVLQALVAPNGEPWPERSGYVAGYPIGNPGKQVQVFIDNSANTAPVFVKLYDLDRNANIRYVYIQPGDTWNVGGLAVGKYEVRYQDVLAGASRSACGDSDKPPPAPASGNPPVTSQIVPSGT
ncbi:J domain-containing protein [Massilia sp. S19_KUP03_FR1]|uniref:J domain-containing protein n=1 Tax=Massilia sp. S19_KUP03_FR1 TaxID=3025503 RepID=UPI002FCD90A8